MFFGVCGLEVSTMLFKLSLPVPVYNRLFCLLSPINEEDNILNNSMFAGGYAARLSSKYNDALSISKNHNYLFI